jgi:hypothetical protein
MGSNNKIPFNPNQIKNGMNVVIRKDGTFKSAVDRKTGKEVKIDRLGNKI